MDRKGKQKVSFLCWIAGVMVVAVILFLYMVLSKQGICKAQKEELSAIYPELADALSENITYYAAKNIQIDFWIMLLMLLLLVIALGGICLLLTSAYKKREAAAENEMDYIYEQLLHFQNGHTGMLPFSAENSSQKFEGVYDRLEELGFYYASLRERLEQEANSTKNLITDISHQLKTPLASIKMSHELSSTSDLSEAERQTFMEAETQEIQKMEVLLDELVKLSRLENGMIQIKPEKYSIKRTISEAVSRIYIQANSKNMEILVDMENDIETPHDHKWTVEALVNILENAVKYSKPMTAIHIRVECLVSNVMIQVEDEGIGIPEGEVHEIFRRFYRGSNAKEHVKEGAGVGLYLARSIVEQQGGTIVAKKKEGNGTIFKLILPLAER